jgi:alkylation response protein AidB-like acyl-CoA dehydrogenase
MGGAHKSGSTIRTWPDRFPGRDDQPGVTSDIHVLGIRAGSTGWVALQDVVVLAPTGRPRRRIRSPCRAWTPAGTPWRLGLLAIRACLEASLRYASPKCLCREIGRFQLVQQKIARMAASYDAACCARWLAKTKGYATARNSSAKWFKTDASFEAASRQSDPRRLRQATI